jgi:hypothetical protein
MKTWGLFNQEADGGIEQRRSRGVAQTNDKRPPIHTIAETLMNRPVVCAVAPPAAMPAA